MHAVIRTYTGNPEVADQLAARSGEIEGVLGGVQGFHGYYLLRTAEGFTTVTVCDDQTAADETTQRAADWLRENAAEIKASAPRVTGGEILIQVGATANV